MAIPAGFLFGGGRSNVWRGEMIGVRTLLVGIGMMVSWGPLSALSTMELNSGAQVKGEVLKEKPDQVFVDLGFTVLAVPRDAIVEIKSDEELQGEEFTNGIYRVNTESVRQSLKELVKMISGAVVTVRTSIGLGSGFIIHPEGYVVTNNHVIEGEYEISVTTFEEGEREMKLDKFDNVRIVASAAELDLALLKIEESDDREFRTVALGDSELLRQGQDVFAIGNPMGLERSVTEGIVSLRNRNIGGSLYVQTTAQISPGNSGGPLFNMQGEVIGVNNMKVVGFGAEGLAFAIPSTVLQMFLSNRDAFAFDPRNPNSGYRYNRPARNAAAIPETERN